MGRRLLDKALRPDLIVSSPALRALSTAELIAQELSLNGHGIRVDPALYESSPECYLKFFTTFPENTRTVLVVGHNPTITECVNLLAPSSVGEMPAGGVVGLIADVASWSELRKRCGKLLLFDYPGKSGQ
jgi:phosphohistidine phosphatase